MLFDLRGRGRRRTVQVIYLSLALLLGGGLVLFGIGGDVSGGLVDAFREGGGNENEAIEEQVDKAEDRVNANRQDPAAWAELALARYQLAGVSEGFDEQAGTFTGEARAQVDQAIRAWDQHLKLAGNNPDPDVAANMKNAFLALDQPERAVRTQEILIDGTENPGYGDYATLAELAYAAGQILKGDRAAQRAKEIAKEENASKEIRDQLKTGLDQAKQQAEAAAAQEATQGAGAAPPATTP
ncbi:MAG: hypothetical protein M3389_09915 [Actinomycetota bacterium]|nr:hypothetical protein [Actinomycetota bacterium]